MDNDPSTVITQKLIEAVFNGTTNLKTIDSSNLRALLLNEIRDFQNYLCEYCDETCDPEDQEFYLRKIKKHLHRTSNFTSFKRWIIRGNPKLMQELGQYLEE